MPALRRPRRLPRTTKRMPRAEASASSFTGRLRAEVLVSEGLALERVELALTDGAGVEQRLGARDVLRGARRGGGTVVVGLRDSVPVAGAGALRHPAPPRDHVHQ